MSYSMFLITVLHATRANVCVCVCVGERIFMCMNVYVFNRCIMLERSSCKNLGQNHFKILKERRRES